ncbi:MAG: pilus (MSHA type) biogenesis protein MshL [Azonexus sp.]|nr:pilus (MSHA type) biogenesis protein MshL [Betaproteobacteria bacterium]MBK8916853.1 pilus (MSHA type) biogenesis protein MshL [Betaproteobacteria bacterium]MBP6036996.1 pilus (MSHA type) biogenesis protein MshL [Azonexus sp.]MBP6907585.1 pilus (MSHA type) biogenesis protein MshL [Azonexus sp.]
MRIVLVLLLGAMLSACNLLQSRPGEAFDRIGNEMKEAAESKRRSPADDAVGRAMMPPVQVAEVIPAKPEPRFNLAVNNAPAGQVFMALVAGTRYSMLFPPELSGALTLNLKDVTVREALDAIRELYGYEYKIAGNRITIQTNSLQSRIYQLNYLASRRQGMTDMRVTSSSPSVVNPSGSSGGSSGSNTSNTTPQAAAAATAAGGTPTAGGLAVSNTDASRVRTSSDNDFWHDLRTALTTIVGGGEGRNVIVSPMSGVVLVKALPQELRAVESYLKATQLMVERQVMLEAKIIEVALNDSFQTGVNWAKFGGNDRRFSAGVLAPGTTLSGNSAALAGTAATSGTAGTGLTITPGTAGAIAATALGQGFFGLAFQSRDFAALVSFLETQGDLQVLSNPRIATLNNQKAVLKVGSDDYFVTNISTSTTTSGTGTVTTPTITLQPFFSGIALDVTPQIDDEGNIILHIHPAVTVVEERSKQVNLGTLGSFTLPLASSTINETDSIVRVQDGHIVAIGGLMSQEQSNSRDGLPGVSRVPGLGLLFGQKGASNRKRELVILIKSTVIQNESSWRQDLVDTQERMQGLDPRKAEWAVK